MCKPWHSINSCKAIQSSTVNGKVERAFRTIKDNFINCTDWNTFTSLEDLNQRYYNYINTEYNNNVHSSIEDTPRKRFMKDYSFIKFVKSDEILEEYFLHSFERKVTTDSTIQLFNKNYEVPSKYIKQRITIKINPHDLKIAYIYENGKKIETIYPVKKVENSKIKRKSISYAEIGGTNND